MKYFDQKQKYVLLIFSAIFLWSVLASCSKVSTAIVDSPVTSIRVVMDNNYPPYIFLDEQGDAKGILVDQWALWEKRTGVTVELSAIPWEDALIGMKEGKFDVIDTIFYTDERAKIYNFTNSYAQINVPIFFHNNISGMAGAEDLKGFRVAVKSGDADAEYLVNAGIKNLVYYNSYEEIIQAAERKEETIFVIDEPPGLYFLYKYGLQNQFNHSAPLFSGEFHRAVKKGDPALLDLVVSGFASISESEYQAIDKRWFGIEQGNRWQEYLSYLLVGTLIVLLIIFILLIFNRTLQKRVNQRTQELKQALSNLQKSEREYREIFNATTEAIFIHAVPGGKLLHVNESMLQMYGYESEAEVLSGDVGDLSVNEPPYTQLDAQEKIRKALEEGPQVFEWLAKKKTGESFWTEVSLRNSPIVGENQILAVVRDITERKQAEKEVQESETRYRALFEDSPVPLLEEDFSIVKRFIDTLRKNGVEDFREYFSTHSEDAKQCASMVHIVDVNKTMLEWYGIKSRAEFQVNLDQVLLSSEYESFIEELLALMQGGDRYELSVSRHARDGKFVHVIINGTIVPGYEESWGRILVSIVDITERKQAEEALSESEKRFRSLYDNATIGMYRTTPDGQIILSNLAGIRMLGYDSFEEIAKRNLEVEGLETDYDRSHFRETIKHAGTVTGLESIWKRKDGSTIYVRESATTVKDNDGNVIYYDGTFEDITERKQAEAALRKSDQRLQVFFNQSLDGFFFCIFEEPCEWKNAKNKEEVLEYIITTQRFTDANDAMLKQYGVSREKFLSLTTSDVFTHDIEQGRKLRRELFDKGRLHLETYERTSDGTPVWFEGEYFCLYDEQERINGFFGLQRDITERKMAEQLQTALYEIANVSQTTISLNDLFASIHKTLGTFMPAENFYIAFYDAQNDLLSFPYFVDQYEKSPAPYKPDNGLTEYVLHTRQPLFATPQVFEEILGSKRIEVQGGIPVDWIGVPLTVSGETFGVMVIQTYTDKLRLTQKDLEFMSFVSTQVAMVIKRKQTEETLLQFREVMDESNDAIFFIDLESSRYIDFNKKALEYLGYTSDELHQLGVIDIAEHVRTSEDWRERIDLISENKGLVFETNYQRKNGTLFPVEVSARVSSYAGKTIIVAVVRDNTERKQSEEAVHQRLAEQGILHRASQSLLAVHLDPEMIYTTLHQAVVQIMPCEVFNIVLDDKSGGDYHAVYLYDAGQRYPARRIPRGQGLSGKVISNGETLFIHDNLQENAPAVRFGSPRAVRSILAVPLRKNNESVGMVSAQSYEPNVYAERHRVLLETLAAQITTVIENANLFEAERKQRQMSDALRDALSAGASMSASLDFETILDHLLETLERVVPFDGGSIMFVRQEQQKINIARMRGYKILEKQAVDNILKFSFDINAVENLRWILNNKQPLVISDVTQYPGWVRVLESSFIHSWIGAPIIVNNEVIALFSLDSAQPNFFTNEHAELLRAFTGQASLALQNARLFDETEHRALEFVSLYETSNALSAENELDGMLQVIVEHAKKLLDSASSGIYLYHSETSELELTVDTKNYSSLKIRLQLNEGVAGRVAKTHQPLRIDDYLTWEGRSPVYDGFSIRAVLGVPMLYGGELIGVLTSDEVGDSERKFTEADERMLSLFASQAAGAIHSARLREQTARRLNQLQSLHTIDRAISSSFDLRPILNTVISQTIAQLGVDAVDVLLFHPHLQTLEYVAGQGFHTRAIERTQIRLGEGYAGRAAFERHTIHVPDLPEAGSNFTRSSLLASEGFLEYYAVPLIAKGEVKGVLEVFHRASLHHNPEWLDFLETLAGQAAITINQTQLFDDLQRANLELIIAYDATIEGWSHAMDLRDRETEGHTLRVTEMTLTLAKAMGISEKEMLHIKRGALLHDIGKMGVPDNILLKEGALTDDEWAIMRQHPIFAYKMLQPIKYLRQSLDIPYCHHEKWDGTGYPRKLQGEQIPLVARIFSVIDVWDAVTIDRPYRKAWTKQKALKYIREQSGKHFDAEVVKTFLKLFDVK